MSHSILLTGLRTNRNALDNLTKTIESYGHQIIDLNQTLCERSAAFEQPARQALVREDRDVAGDLASESSELCHKLERASLEAMELWCDIVRENRGLLLRHRKPEFKHETERRVGL